MNQDTLQNLEESLIRNLENNGYPELAAAGLNLAKLKTLIQVWKSRGGDLANLVESLACADYALENQLSDSSGRPYSFQRIYETLWRGKLIILNPKESQPPEHIVKLNLSKTEIKTIDFISQLAMAPVTIDLVAVSVGISETDMAEMLDRFRKKDIVEIYTDGDSEFLVIKLSERILSDGKGYLWTV